MKTLIIGQGEIGTALKEVLEKKYKVSTYDIKGSDVLQIGAEVLHICIPYSERFVEIVNEYIELVNPIFTVVHSSVPVGTCAKLKDACHSPVRGKHPAMVKGLLTYVKYLSGFADNLLLRYFEDVGIQVKYTGRDTKVTELMKLLELCRYGVYIAFAKEQEKICEKFNLPYEEVVTEYERTRNDGIEPALRQPLLTPFENYVGGHCTVEDMELMLGQVKAPLLEEAYKIDRATVTWPNSNIYKSAIIGKGCSIGQFCEIGHEVKIGNNVRIGAFTFLPEGVTIEDDVFIAPRVSVSNDKYPPSKKECWGKVLIKKGAMVGLGTIILPGVTIGANALVGAGSVVTKDVPDGEKWYGVPARSAGLLNGNEHKEMEQEFTFDSI